MRTVAILASVLLAHAQSFDVASSRGSPQTVGPDFNNQLIYSGTSFSAHNITLVRLIAEAYRFQLSQVSGPKWITTNEYEVEARSAAPVTPAMLQSLLAERFQLKSHTESRTLRAYELTVDPGGFKTPTANKGFHFHGDMRQFADLIGIQLSIPEGDDPSRPTMGSTTPLPVTDKTGLTGPYDFYLPLGPGVDLPSLLREQLGLRLDNRRGPVEVLIVDSALQTPTAN